MDLIHAQVALVHVDERYWLDRQIAQMGPEGQNYSHAAWVFSGEGLLPMWADVHWRWFRSSLRMFPEENYAWTYDLFNIDRMGESEAVRLLWWLVGISPRTNYDLLQACGMFVADRLGLSRPLFGNSKSALQCFELILTGLQKMGYKPRDIDPSMVLGSHLLDSGLLEFVETVER